TEQKRPRLAGARRSPGRVASRLLAPGAGALGDHEVALHGAPGLQVAVAGPMPVTVQAAVVAVPLLELFGAKRRWPRRTGTDRHRANDRERRGQPYLLVHGSSSLLGSLTAAPGRYPTRGRSILTVCPDWGSAIGMKVPKDVFTPIQPFAGTLAGSQTRNPPCAPSASSPCCPCCCRLPPSPARATTWMPSPPASRAWTDSSRRPSTTSTASSRKPPAAALRCRRRGCS